MKYIHLTSSAFISDFMIIIIFLQCFKHALLRSPDETHHKGELVCVCVWMNKRNRSQCLTPKWVITFISHKTLIFLRTPENPCLPILNLLQLLTKLQIIHTYPEAHRTRNKSLCTLSKYFSVSPRKLSKFGLCCTFHIKFISLLGSNNSLISIDS